MTVNVAGGATQRSGNSTFSRDDFSRPPNYDLTCAFSGYATVRYECTTAFHDVVVIVPTINLVTMPRNCPPRRCGVWNAVAEAHSALRTTPFASRRRAGTAVRVSQDGSALDDSASDVLGDLDDELELGDFLVGPQRVAPRRWTRTRTAPTGTADPTG